MLLVIPIAVKIFYPIYFKMELTSCYEFLGIRFGKEIRIMGGVLYVIQVCRHVDVNAIVLHFNFLKLYVFRCVFTRL